MQTIKFLTLFQLSANLAVSYKVKSLIGHTPDQTVPRVRRLQFKCWCALYCCSWRGVASGVHVDWLLRRAFKWFVSVLGVWAQQRTFAHSFNWTESDKVLHYSLFYTICNSQWFGTKVTYDARVAAIQVLEKEQRMNNNAKSDTILRFSAQQRRNIKPDENYNQS